MKKISTLDWVMLALIVLSLLDLDYQRVSLLQVVKLGLMAVWVTLFALKVKR